VDADRAQLLRGAPGFQDGRRFGVHHEGEGALLRIAHHLDHFAKTLLGYVVGRSRIYRSKDLHVDLLAPIHRQLQQAQGVAGGGGVEHHRLPSLLRGVLDELVEGGHLFGAGRVQLFRHHLDGRFGPAALAGIVQDALL
jgi:hypothetical protein